MINQDHGRPASRVQPACRSQTVTGSQCNHRPAPLKFEDPAILNTGGADVELAAISGAKPDTTLGFIKPHGKNEFSQYNTRAKFAAYETFEVEDKDRFWDTEHTLLEEIRYRLRGTSPVGTLALYSYIRVCESCQGVIRQFQEEFPGIKMRVKAEWQVAGWG